ncbi:MAG: hypothetical protein WCB59_21885, partial [Candidatus Sulfotelmatobacter sp.]
PGKLNKWGAYASESRSFRHAAQLFLSINKPTIEAELMDWADDVTYQFMTSRIFIGLADYHCICWLIVIRASENPSSKMCLSAVRMTLTFRPDRI